MTRRWCVLAVLLPAVLGVALGGCSSAGGPGATSSTAAGATASGAAGGTASGAAGATASGAGSGGAVAPTDPTSTGFAVATDGATGEATDGTTGEPATPDGIATGQEPIGTEPAEDPSIEAWSYDVRVVFPLTGEAGTPEEFDRISRLEAVIIEAADATGDVFDGNDLGQGVQTDYVFTNQPDPIVAALTTRLRAAGAPKGTRIEVHRYLQDEVLRTVTL